MSGLVVLVPDVVHIGVPVVSGPICSPLWIVGPAIDVVIIGVVVVPIVRVLVGVVEVLVAEILAKTVDSTRMRTIS